MNDSRKNVPLSGRVVLLHIVWYIGLAAVSALSGYVGDAERAGVDVGVDKWLGVVTWACLTILFAVAAVGLGANSDD